MLSKKAVNYLGRIQNVGHFVFGCHPFYWDRKRRRFCNNQSIKYKILYSCQLSMLILYEIFLVIRCVQTVQSETASQARKVRSVYVTLALILMNFSHCVTISNYNSLHTLLNSFIDVTTFFEESQMDYDEDENVKSKEGSKKSVRFSKLALFVWFFSAITNALSCIRSPSQPHLLTSLTPNPDELPLVAKVLIGYLHFQIIVFQTSLPLMFASIFVCYVYAVLPMMRRMTVVEINIHVSWRKFQTMQIDQLGRYYTQLKVLQGNFNNSAGTFVLGAVIFALYLCITNYAQSVIYGSVRSFILATSQMMLCVQGFGVFGQIYEMSHKMLVSWKSIQDKPKWFRKQCRACEAQKITIGSFFYIDRGFILTFVGIIVSKSVDILVTYRVD